MEHLLTHTPLVLIPNSDKKPKHIYGAQSRQTDITFRHIRKTGTTTALLPDGNRVIIACPNHEQDSRWVSTTFPKMCRLFQFSIL